MKAFLESGELLHEDDSDTWDFVRLREKIELRFNDPRELVPAWVALRVVLPDGTELRPFRYDESPVTSDGRTIVL